VKSPAAFIQTEGATGFEMSNRPIASSIDVAILDPLQDPDWDHLVASHPDCNFFHSAAWAKVLVKTYAHKPFYLYFSRQFQAVALVPIMEIKSVFTGRRGVSLPFSDFCAPLIFDQSESARVIGKISELGRERRWRYFELRGGRTSLPGSAVSGEKYYGHKLDLTIGLDKLFDRFQSSVRRAIRKAEKSELVAHASRAWEAMMEFYKLHVRTRRRHGLPPQPLSFFRNIDEEVIKAGLGFVVLAKRHLKPIAAAVFFHSGEEALFKFGASDERFQEVRGNNLVMWEGIKRLVEKGTKTMHFGRTTTTDEGLRRFKLSWGTEEEAIEYFRFALRTQAWDNSRRDGSGLHNQFFGRLPLAVNRLAGALVYRHLD
jgi:Acetyltransferase (GNAT) domain